MSTSIIRVEAKPFAAGQTGFSAIVIAASSNARFA